MPVVCGKTVSHIDAPFSLHASIAFNFVFDDMALFNSSSTATCCFCLAALNLDLIADFSLSYKNVFLIHHIFCHILWLFLSFDIQHLRFFDGMMIPIPQSFADNRSVSLKMYSCRSTLKKLFMASSSGFSKADM